MTTYIRPSADALAEPFWRSILDGKLRIQRCARCGRFRHPPQPICAACSSFEDEWVEVSGRATLYSFTIVHHPVHPAVESWVPYATGLVELDEGVRMVSLVKGVPLDEVRIGMRLKMVFSDVAPDFALPVFEPADGADGR